MLIASIDAAGLSPFRFHGWEGKRLTASFGWRYDFDDATFAPAEPIPAWLMPVRERAAQFAGLGGTERYVKTSAFITQFVPIWFDHVLSGRLEGDYGFGWSDKPMPLFERFYLGGPNSIRSFKARQISPKDEFGTRIGGTSEVLGNVEYLIPLPFDIRLAAFFDVGNVYGFKTKFDLTDLHYAAGGGIRWVSPFGPIRVDYGFNLNQQPGEKPSNFHFSVGSPF